MNRLTLLAAGALALAGAAAQAQVVVRDAQTGQLRAPNAAEMQQLEVARQLRDRANRGVLSGKLNPQPVRMPGGEDMLEHTEAMMNHTVVVTLPGGRLVRQCVADMAMAERVARGEMPSFAKSMQERLNER